MQAEHVELGLLLGAVETTARPLWWTSSISAVGLLPAVAEQLLEHAGRRSDMRLIGSFQTITIQGRSGSADLVGGRLAGSTCTSARPGPGVAPGPPIGRSRPPSMAVAARPLVPSRLAPSGLVRWRDARRDQGGRLRRAHKPRIIELLLVTTVPTMVVAERGLPVALADPGHLVGGTLAAGGANAINMVVDRDIDRLMQRTQRPAAGHRRARARARSCSPSPSRSPPSRSCGPRSTCCRPCSRCRPRCSTSSCTRSG